MRVDIFVRNLTDVQGFLRHSTPPRSASFWVWQPLLLQTVLNPMNTGHHRRSSEESYESGEAKYDFQWAVDHDDSGNNYGHQEARDGEDTQGSYYMLLPDGRLQTVRYVVDGDDGYVADG
ncbi:uncharacterized protein LOC125032062 [Penaeus chinensis]|uniref:uncharacterized protein LOC125032062 n=1 Tax=Penaeus chinensis TaxID=139456 RepID=UPI001FB5E9E0|nr:uncharacterized protein LOC125032062 [Penaeus chinensis]